MEIANSHTPLRHGDGALTLSPTPPVPWRSWRPGTGQILLGPGASVGGSGRVLCGTRGASGVGQRSFTPCRPMGRLAACMLT